MRLLSVLASAALATMAVACRSNKVQGPTWVQTAPARSQAAVSGQASWILEQPQFQAQLSKFPMAEQSLELFLKKARISPHGETGRVTLFVLDPIQEINTQKGQVKTPGFLLQFQGFRDPRSLQIAVAESFPAEGTLQVRGNDLPLHVVLDFNQTHVRVLTDLDGTIWLGELASLTSLSAKGPLPRNHPIISAVTWIDASAPLQGFLRPDEMLKGLSGQLSSDISRELPKGIECLAWSVKPGPGDPSLYALEISITGTQDGIQQATPWLQRIVAITTSIRSSSAAPPELLQERHRAMLRCQLSWDQVNQVLSKLKQPGILPNPGKKAPLS
jgi:hypothetical protein